MYLGATTFPGASTFPGVVAVDGGTPPPPPPPPSPPGGIFRAPIYQRLMPISPPLMARMNYSKAVLRIQGQWVETEWPSADQIDAADYYFPGGHEIPVDQATADVLTAAGYTVDPLPALPTSALADSALVDFSTAA